MKAKQVDSDIVVDVEALNNDAGKPGVNEAGQLLADVPAERHITVSWKEVNATVTTFVADKSILSRFQGGKGKPGDTVSKRQVRSSVGSSLCR